MFDNVNERADVEEVYQVAGNTSDLRVVADRRGAGDVLIAAGWSESRVGMALLRLHSEWNALAKPRRIGKPALDVIAARIKAQDASERATATKLGRKHDTPKQSAQVRAAEEAQRWYTNELRIMANGLKSRSAAWALLAPWIEQKGINPDVMAEALLYWLDPTCRACDGHGLRKIPDQPALSARQCHKCGGTGNRPHPHGTAKVLVYLDECVSRARQSLKKRLHSESR